MPSRGGTSERPTFERLRAEECWRLLASQSLGRVCVCVDDRVQVVLAPYVVRGECLYFRATAFGPIARRARSGLVTMEVDDVSEHPVAGWSVTAHGLAHHVSDAATLASLWSPVRPTAWEPGLEPLWIALVPDSVEGRRLSGSASRPATP